MYFSRLILKDNAVKTPMFAKVFANPYALHQELWQVFSDSPDRRRDFLYRLEKSEKNPIIYTVSERIPNKDNELWSVETKSYCPNIVKGQLLMFSLQANPVDITKENRPSEKIDLWKKNRIAKGLKEKDVTKKRVRHDVVMFAKKKMGWSDLSVKERPPLAQVIHEAGLTWLQKRSVKNGFHIDINKIRIDGYMRHCFLKGAKEIKLSTLEFNGVLKVEEPENFLQMIYQGLGPAKGFGCGLMLIKRI